MKKDKLIIISIIAITIIAITYIIFDYKKDQEKLSFEKKQYYEEQERIEKEQEKLKEEQEQKENKLNSCLNNAKENRKNLWNANCQNGETNCRLPEHIVSWIDSKYNQEVDVCLQKYK